jgi:hypothetical protein
VKRKKDRIIEQLRSRYPGVWYYAGGHRWVNLTQGWHVQGYAKLTPKYEGDDESFTVQYRRNDTGQVVIDSFAEFLQGLGK